RLGAPRQAQEGAFQGGPGMAASHSDEWSRGTASMASAQAIQASCQDLCVAKNLFISVYYGASGVKFTALWEPVPAFEICDSLNSCAAHKNWAGRPIAHL